MSRFIAALRLTGTKPITNKFGQNRANAQNSTFFMLRKCKENAKQGVFLAFKKQKSVVFSFKSGIMTFEITRYIGKRKSNVWRDGKAAGCYFY